MQSVWRNPYHFLAFGFGLGTLPLAPGTFGTLAGVVIYLLLSNFSLPVYLLWVALLTIFGVWLCDKVSKDLGVHDHSGIVWDEICGYLLTMVALPNTFLSLTLAFFAFRVFDVIKPWPIKVVDEKVKGGLGIMLDDVLAALPAWGVCFGILWWLDKL